jgi:hypothetical protein
MPSPQITSGLIQGPARIFTAQFGSALPTRSDVSALVSGGLSGWSSRGRTTEGVNLVDTPELVRAESDQALRSEAVAVSRWETVFETVCREVTASNLALAMHGMETFGGVQPNVSGLVRELSVAMVGPGPGGTQTLIVIERAFINNGAQVTFSRQSYSELPLNFEVLEPVTTAYGYTVDFVEPNDTFGDVFDEGSEGEGEGEA